MGRKMYLTDGQKRGIMKIRGNLFRGVATVE
nr:MAG TPA: HSIE1 protein [Caudoviricetes sp.]